MKNHIETGIIIENVALIEKGIDVYNKNYKNNWVAQAYREFSSIVGGEGFPCLFGRSALKRRSMKFLFVSQKKHKKNLIDGFLAYTSFVRETPLNERLYSPLIVIFERTDFPNLNAEHKFCWEQLRILHENDPAVWHLDIPKDPNDSQWTFCFNAEQLFFNISCPKHLKLKSRHLGQRVTFIVNPRKNFDAIASLNSKKGIMVRQTIRKRVKNYNDGFVPSELGFFGDKTTLNGSNINCMNRRSRRHLNVHF